MRGYAITRCRRNVPNKIPRTMDFSFVVDSLRPLVRSAHASLQSDPGLATFLSMDNTTLADLCLDNDTGKPDTEQTVLRCARALGCKNVELAIKSASDHLYVIFKREYRPENGKNIKRVFDVHFEPLVNAFGLTTMQKPPSEETIVSFKKFLEHKKGHYAKFRGKYYPYMFSKIQADPEYAKIARRIIPVDEDCVTTLWERCRGFCSITYYEEPATGRLAKRHIEPYNNTRVTKTVIRKHARLLPALLGVEDVSVDGVGSALSYAKALEFCSQKGRVTGSRILVLRSVGFPGAGALEKDLIKRAARTERFFAFHTDILKNAFEYRLQCYDTLLAMMDIDALDDIAHLEIGHLQEALEHSEQPHNHLRIVKGILSLCDRNEDYGTLEACFSWKHTRKLNSERWSERGDWHREILELIMRNHAGRVKQTSAYVEEHMALLASRSAAMLMFLSEYTATLPGLPDGTEEPLRWFLASCTYQMVRDSVLAYARTAGVDNTRVKSVHSSHHAKRPASAMITMYKKGLRDTMPCHSELGSLVPGYITEQIDDLRVKADPSKRRVYKDEEIRLLLGAVGDDNPRDILLITILREVGLRVGALSNLVYHDIVDNHHHPKHLCRVMEKGRQIREFVTGANLKSVIVTYVRWVETNELDTKRLYVFARDSNPYSPPCRGTIQHLLSKYAQDANITEVRVHPHAFRHTIVGKLMDAGNNLEVVSKFMGHKSVQTTSQYYWLADIEKLCENMKNPFTSTVYENDQEKESLCEQQLEYVRGKLEVGIKMLCIYNISIAKYVEAHPEAMALRDDIHERIPNLNGLLNSLAASMSGSTTGTDSTYTS